MLALRSTLREPVFELSVWNALLQIPVGEVSSYKAVAQAIGKPKAVRA